MDQEQQKALMSAIASKVAGAAVQMAQVVDVGAVVVMMFAPDVEREGATMSVTALRVGQDVNDAALARCLEGAAANLVSTIEQDEEPQRPAVPH